MIAGTALLEIGVVGMTIIEFLAPPSAWTRLPVCGRAGGDQPGGARLADEGDRVDAGVVEDRLDRLAAAVDEVDDAGREDLLFVDQLADPLGGRGSRSEGLSMKALPQATA